MLYNMSLNLLHDSEVQLVIAYLSALFLNSVLFGVQEQPVAIEPAMFPTWPAKSEGNRRTTHSPRPPAGGAAYAQYARADSDEALGFQLHQRSLNVAPGFSLKF